MAERYRKLSTYLKEKYGVRVHKIGVDAGFSCPNRDGTISQAGCIYCNNAAFSFHSRQTTPPPLAAQIETGIAAARQRFKAKKFILYFQAYTNTYGPLTELKEKYDIINQYSDIIGLAIGTRPDCINEAALNLISSYRDRYNVWLEYGLQSSHNQTLQAINRGHTYEDFLQAVNQTRQYKLNICAHMILGLPGESQEMILATARELARLKINSVKIHPLHIIRGTPLEQLFREGKYQPLTYNSYLDLLAEFISRLWPQTTIQRLSASCPRELLITPSWLAQRHSTDNDLERILTQKGYFQGSAYTGAH